METLKYILDRYSVDTNDPLPYRLNISRWSDFVKLFRRLNFRTGVEIGVARGDMSLSICKANPELKLYSVDPWLAYPGYRDINRQWKQDENEAVARAKLAPYNNTIIKRTSMDAVKGFAPGSVDFVFIDGNHDYEYVMEDIVHWEKTVRTGGIVAGHDYVNRSDFGVIRAVKEYVKEHRIGAWFITAKDRSPTWFWVKE